MEKRGKIILIIVFALVATLGVSLGFVLQDYLSVTSQSSIINLEDDGEVPENIPDEVENTPPPINETPPVTDKIEFKGENYTVFKEGELKALGPNKVECPYCKGIAIQVGSNTIEGWYYYYYKCEECGVNIAEYAKIG
ncbi:MAG: hypothetical protein ACP5C3_05060 [Methanomicrobiales archaeon]